jgi:hypothetical protein
MEEDGPPGTAGGEIPVSSDLEQAALRRERHSVSPVFGAQLVENRCDVILDRSLGDAQRLRNMLVSQAFGD